MVLGKVFGGVVRLFVTLFAPNHGRQAISNNSIDPTRDSSSDAPRPKEDKSVLSVAQIPAKEQTHSSVELETGHGHEALQSAFAENQFLRREVCYLRMRFETIRTGNRDLTLKADEWRQKALAWKAKSHETMKKMDMVRLYMASERVDAGGGIVELACHFSKLERDTEQARLKAVAAASRNADARSDVTPQV